MKVSLTKVFFFQAEDGIRDLYVTGVQTCALPISSANNVSNASELLPEPLKPVMTMSWRNGRSRSKSFRLLCRTPRRRITDDDDFFGIGRNVRAISEVSIQRVTRKN